LFQNSAEKPIAADKWRQNLRFLIMENVRIRDQVNTDESGVVLVDSPELLNELIQNNEKMIKELEGLNIKKAEISVSKDGKVQFTNRTLFEKIREGLFQLESDGCGCGCGCGCNLGCSGCGTCCGQQSLEDFFKLASQPKDYVTKLSSESVIKKKI
jgi:hypothetical protein